MDGRGGGGEEEKRKERRREEKMSHERELRGGVLYYD